MKIILDNIEDISEIRPHFKSTYEGVKIELRVGMSRHRMEELVYQLWEDLGDEYFFKLLEAEGYKVTKNEKS